MKTIITETEIVHYFDSSYYKCEEIRQKIKQMRAEKKTYAEIGKELGLSRQRVHQIAKELGV